MKEIKVRIQLGSRWIHVHHPGNWIAWAETVGGVRFPRRGRYVASGDTLDELLEELFVDGPKSVERLLLERLIDNHEFETIKITRED